MQTYLAPSPSLQVLATGWCPPSQIPKLPVLKGDLCDTIDILLVTNPAKHFAYLGLMPEKGFIDLDDDPRTTNH